jgi:hypothetical protein
MPSSNNNAKSAISPSFSSPLNSRSNDEMVTRKDTRFAGRATRSEPGGNLKSAQVVRPIPGAFKRADTVGKGDRDVFKAVFTSTAQVDISFRNKAFTPITLSILDSQGKVINFGGQSLSQAVGRGTFVQSLTGVLPGTYFIRLVAKAKTPAKYRINITTASLSVPT